MAKFGTDTENIHLKRMGSKKCSDILMGNFFYRLLNPNGTGLFDVEGGGGGLFSLQLLDLQESL